jgi:hypothetical protein
MQELLKLQSEQLKKNTSSLEVNTASNDQMVADVGRLSIAVEHAANDDIIKQEEKRTKELTEGLKSLAEVIKKNIAVAMKQGGGEATAKGVIKSDAEKAKQTGGLRSFLLGGQTKDEIKKGSWFEKAEHLTGLKVAKYSPSGAIDKWLTKREEKQNTAKEKQEYVKNAMQHDPRIYAGRANFAGGMKTEEGRAIAKEDAEKQFEAIKAKEAELKTIQTKMDSAKEAGYNPLVKDTKTRDTLAGELTELDPRRKKEFVTPNGKPVDQTVKSVGDKKQAVKQEMSLADGANVTVKPEIHDEAKEETQALSTKMHDEDIQTEKGLGSTLIQSLEIQKQSLQMLTKISEKEFGGGGGSDSGGGGLLDTAADLAGNVGKKGAGMLGKAGKFLGKHAGKLGAIAGVAAGAYEAYEGWGNANEKEAASNADVDNKLATGEITQQQADQMKKMNGDQADVSKGGAVGGGVGGAAGAWGGAAAGAAIGSVVPVVGTAIGGLVGGAIGYYGGSKIGEKVGGSLVEGYKGVKNFLGFGGDEKKAGEPTVAAAPKSTTQQWTEIAGEKVTPGQELSQKQMAVMGMAIQSGNTYSPEIMAQYNKQKNAPTASPTDSSATAVNGSNVYGESKSNADAAAQTSGAASSNNIVNAPSNVTNNYSSSSTPRVPPRNQDSSVSRYIGSRYAAY